MVKRQELRGWSFKCAVCRNAASPSIKEEEGVESDSCQEKCPRSGFMAAARRGVHGPPEICESRALQQSE